MRRKDKGSKDKHRVPPGATTAAQPQKIPRVGENVDFWQAHPIWSFELLDLVAQVGGWSRLHPNNLDELLARFRQWETMAWKQILVDAKKQNHAIDVSQCCPESQNG